MKDPTGKRFTFTVNGTEWVYDFKLLTAPQVYGAIAWFEFHNQQILNPPASARHLQLSGGVDYMQGAFGRLLCKKLPDGTFEKFNADKTPQEAEAAFAELAGQAREIEAARMDFFSIIEMRSIESYKQVTYLMSGIMAVLSTMKGTNESGSLPESAT